MEDMITATALVTAMAMVIVIPVATTTIITVTGILMDIINPAVAGITVTMDQGMDSVIGDEIKGQGE